MLPNAMLPNALSVCGLKNAIDQLFIGTATATININAVLLDLYYTSSALELLELPEA